MSARGKSALALAVCALGLCLMAAGAARGHGAGPAPPGKGVVACSSVSYAKFLYIFSLGVDFLRCFAYNYTL